LVQINTIVCLELHIIDSSTNFKEYLNANMFNEGKSHNCIYVGVRKCRDVVMIACWSETQKNVLREAREYDYFAELRSDINVATTLSSYYKCTGARSNPIRVMVPLARVLTIASMYSHYLANINFSHHQCVR
jgi:hypothetical protein